MRCVHPGDDSWNPLAGFAPDRSTERLGFERTKLESRRWREVSLAPWARVTAKTWLRLLVAVREELGHASLKGLRKDYVLQRSPGLLELEPVRDGVSGESVAQFVVACVLDASERLAGRGGPYSVGRQAMTTLTESLLDATDRARPIVLTMQHAFVGIGRCIRGDLMPPSDHASDRFIAIVERITDDGVAIGQSPLAVLKILSSAPAAVRYSDQEIRDLLEQRFGIHAGPRTVAKKHISKLRRLGVSIPDARKVGGYMLDGG